jgi:hypothetical protein
LSWLGPGLWLGCDEQETLSRACRTLSKSWRAIECMADIVGIRNNRHGNGLRLVPGRQIAPHLELSQHPIRKRKTYDEYVGEGVMFVTRA